MQNDRIVEGSIELTQRIVLGTEVLQNVPENHEVKRILQTSSHKAAFSTSSSATVI
jgi:hypothetical protein